MDQRVENRNPWNPPGFRPSSTQLSSFRAVNFGGNSWHHRENRSTAFCVTSPARDIIFKERQGSWLTLRWLEISSIQLDLVNQVCGHIYRPNQPEIVLWPKPTERKDIVWEIFRGKDLANLRFSDSKKKKKTLYWSTPISSSRWLLLQELKLEWKLFPRGLCVPFTSDTASSVLLLHFVIAGGFAQYWL